MHFPFHCRATVKAILSAIKKENPDIVVQIGDLYDFYSASRFPKKPGVISPQDELEQAYEFSQEFWVDVQRASNKKIQCNQLLGNHCVRPLKLTLERCPELFPLVERSWKELFRFKGVDTLYDIRDDLLIDNVIYEHGSYSKPGMHMRDNMMNSVMGHTHRPWIHFEQIRNKLLWELNVGYVGNPEHPALQYTRKKYNKWVHGYGVIEDGIPRFIPL